MKKVSFDSVQHLIPENCWYKDQHYDEQVLLCEGDQNWKNPVDLDHIFGAEQDAEFYPLVLVTGNLQATQIFNTDTDGSSGLIVLGDLLAENVLVGGQEIYICGNLHVRGLFWGDYNHGSLHVEGNIRASVFLNTDYNVDSYRFLALENLTIPHLLWDEIDEDYDHPDYLTMLFDKAFLFNEDEMGEVAYSWKDWIKAEQLYEALRENRSVLLESVTAAENMQAPFFFADQEISPSNLLRFAEGILLSRENDQPGEDRQLAYWDGDVFRRIFMRSCEPLSCMLYFQKSEEFGCLVYFGFDPASMNNIMMPKKPVFALAFRELNEVGEVWHPFSLLSPSRYRDFLKEQWPLLLDHYSEMNFLEETLQRKVSVETFKAIMDVPLVKKMAKKHDDDDGAIFFRGFQWEFQNENRAEDQHARISIVKDLGKDRFECYYFYLLETVSGDPAVFLYTQENDDDELYEVQPIDRWKIRRALLFFDLLEKNIFRLNDSY
ncbi:hypothetical protein [Sphingobacterium deserti]|uniref:Uncharacterized protein n=1 Tax=Sphingobacterium deserti TaxID=1229276 RepID=A0A0B8T5T9_9SPHI|nr:hypothetical protein [Sphingobacterium deserti]KGE13119.1 hypothetical protein DI53_3143 [Sphingobacterium deserti]